MAVRDTKKIELDTPEAQGRNKQLSLPAQTYPRTLASSKKFDPSGVKGGAQFLNGVLPAPQLTIL
ncbi:UNVERIFIED_CONTAM: hypothetical protein NY603_30020, partial [Bacteroidetes bacterium 56_B9]